MSQPFEVVFARKQMPYDHRDYQLSRFITPEMRARAAATSAQDWPVSRVLDQGDTPHCVGFAWAGFGVAEPVPDDWHNDMGDKIYYQAKIEDGEPGQEDGSDTRSGVKGFMHFGKLKGDTYAFAASLDDILTWVLANGPVVTGTNWYSSMMNTDGQGCLQVSGSIVGGHEWMICGVDKERQELHCLNSWGEGWGLHGHFTISFADYQRLFNEQGDAVTTLEIASTPEPTPVPTPDPTGCITVIAPLLDRIAKALEKIAARKK